MLMPTKEIVNDATMELALRDAKREKLILVLSYREEQLDSAEGKETMKQFKKLKEKTPGVSFFTQNHSVFDKPP